MELRSSKVKEIGKVDEDLPKDIPITEVCRGLKVWRNPVNKFFVGRLHYSADPRKRTKEFQEEARSGITYAQFMREYEIVGSSFEGVPVFLEQYSKAFHVSDESLEWAMEYPVVRGWDFGIQVLGMACCFTQLVSNSRLLVLKELVASESDIDTFAEAVQRYSLEWFPGCRRFIDIVDPSGFNRNGAAKDKRSYTDVLKQVLKAKPIPGEKTLNKRLKSVVDRLNGSVRGQPRLLISGPDCPTLVEGFDGGYFYAYTKDGQTKDEPEKNKWSHIMDSLQMVTTRIDSIDLWEDPDEDSTPASPHYNFGR